MVQWKINGIFKADPNMVYDEITSIGDTFTPEEIVSYAEANPDSQLHKCFEWDDGVAAKRYRINQAQMVIRNIVIVKESDDENEENRQWVVRAITSTNERTNCYEPISRTVVNPDSYGRLLDAAAKELRAFKKKYETLNELSEIFSEIEMFLAS